MGTRQAIFDLTGRLRQALTIERKYAEVITVIRSTKYNPPALIGGDVRGITRSGGAAQRGKLTADGVDAESQNGVLHFCPDIKESLVGRKLQRLRRAGHY